MKQVSPLFKELFGEQKLPLKPTLRVSKTYNKTPMPLAGADARPAVSELIDEHIDHIKEIDEILLNDPLYDPNIHDDLWKLRFFLSQKTTEKAANAARATLQFRDKYKLDQLGDIRHQWIEIQKTLLKEKKGVYQSHTEDNTNVYTIPDSNRGVIIYIQFRAIDQRKITKVLDKDGFLQFYILLNEWTFQVNDETTRRTGRLTKSLKVLDLEGSNLLRDVNPAFIKRDAELNKKLQDFYPQALGSMLVVNAPSVFNALWNFFRPFFPKRMVEKVSLVQPKKVADDLKCFTRYISEDHLPEEYGGNALNKPSSFGLFRFAES